MLQDCLLALSCDEWHHVASAANSSLMFLTSVGEGLKNVNGGTDVEILHRSRCIHRSRFQKQSLLNVLQRYGLSHNTKLISLSSIVLLIWVMCMVLIP